MFLVRFNSRNKIIVLSPAALTLRMMTILHIFSGISNSDGQASNLSLNLSQNDVTSTSLDESGRAAAEDSLNFPPVTSVDDVNKSTGVVDESFAFLCKKKIKIPKPVDSSKDGQQVPKPIEIILSITGNTFHDLLFSLFAS